MDFYQAMWIWKAAVLPGESFIIEKEIPLSLGHCPMHKQYPHWTTHVHTSAEQSHDHPLLADRGAAVPPPKAARWEIIEATKEIYPKGFTHSLTHCLVWVCVRIRWGKNRGIRPMQI